MIEPRFWWTRTTFKTLSQAAYSFQQQVYPREPENYGNWQSQLSRGCMPRWTLWDFFSYENVAIVFTSRCGFDMTTSMECVFGTSSKAIGKERPWSDASFLFYDENLQRDYIEEFQKVVRHESTVYRTYTSPNCRRPKVLPVLLLLVNIRYVVVGTEKNEWWWLDWTR